MFFFHVQKYIYVNKHAGHDAGGCWDLLQFCAANPLNPSTPRNHVTNHSSENDSLEDSEVPNVEDINDPVKLKELLQEYLQKYKDLSRQVSNDGAGGGVVLGG